MNAPIAATQLVIEHLALDGITASGRYDRSMLSSPGAVLVEDIGGTVPHIDQEVFRPQLRLVVYSNEGDSAARAYTWRAIYRLRASQRAGTHTAAGGIHRLTVLVHPQIQQLRGLPVETSRVTAIIDMIVRTVDQWADA